MSARIFPFAYSPLPEIVYLDTSFVWEIYDVTAQPHRQQQCLEFLNRLMRANIPMIINSLVIQELWHVILRSVYCPFAFARRIGWLELFRQDKSFMPQVIQEIRRVEGLLNANPFIVRIDIQLSLATDATAFTLMELYNLDSANAYHVALARAEQVNSFITLDQGFGQVDTINVYTCDSTLLQQQTMATEPLPFPETL